MFVCSVAVGRANKTQARELDPSQCPGTGFHSMVGEVRVGWLVAITQTWGAEGKMNGK